MQDTIDGYTEGEEVLNFHYSREERLKRAPQSVKDYYDGKMNIKRGIFRSLVATQANRYMLFSIALCMAALFFVSKFGSDSSVDIIDDARAEVAAFSFEDTVYVSTKIRSAKKDGSIAKSDDASAYILALDDDKNEIASAEYSDLFDGKELAWITKFDDNGITYIEANVEIYGKSKKLLTKVKKN